MTRKSSRKSWMRKIFLRCLAAILGSLLATSLLHAYQIWVFGTGGDERAAWDTLVFQTDNTGVTIPGGRAGHDGMAHTAPNDDALGLLYVIDRVSNTSACNGAVTDEGNLGDATAYDDPGVNLYSETIEALAEWTNIASSVVNFNFVCSFNDLGASSFDGVIGAAEEHDAWEDMGGTFAFNTDGYNEIFFDDTATGDYFDAVAGPVDTTAVLGIAFPLDAFGNFILDSGLNPISEAFILINQTSLAPAYSVLEVVTHEVGHTLGLAHPGVILNARAEYFGSPNDTLNNGLIPTSLDQIPTMFFVLDSVQDGAALKPDDIAGITLNYPESGAGSSFGAISGIVLDENEDPLLGAGVIAYGISAGLEGLEIGIILGGNPDLANNLTGGYQIDFVPPGDYLVTLVPLLGDLESAAYLASDHDPFFLLNTNPLIFAQRYFDEVDEEAMATSVTVVASNIRANVNFLNVPSSSEGIPSGGGGGTSIPTVLLSEDAAAGCQVRSIPFSPNALVEMMLFFTPLLLPLWKKRTLP